MLNDIKNYANHNVQKKNWHKKYDYVNLLIIFIKKNKVLCAHSFHLYFAAYYLVKL